MFFFQKKLDYQLGEKVSHQCIKYPIARICQMKIKFNEYFAKRECSTWMNCRINTIIEKILPFFERQWINIIGTKLYCFETLKKHNNLGNYCVFICAYFVGFKIHLGQY